MNGTWYKKLCRQNHYSKEEKKEHRFLFGRAEAVRKRFVFKLVSRLWRLFTKAPWYDGDHCVFWYDVNDSLGYRECCEFGGLCDDSSDRCPYKHLKKLRGAMKEADCG